jgi:predicted metal-dependent peptidase
MSTFPVKDEDRETLQRIEDGLRLVTVSFPHFAGLARVVRVCLDERVPTMGVFASGRLLVNPRFARGLKENELVFVLAHELFHLALRTHERAKGSDPLQFNYAHDYIINDILRVALQFHSIPAGGLDWRGARKLSAEEILLQMKDDPSIIPARTRVWQGRATSGRRIFGQGAGQRSGSGPGADPRDFPGDVFDDQTERELFPGEDAADQQAQAEAAREAAAKALSLGAAMGAVQGRGRGTDAGASNQLVTALRGMYRTPWEAALQRWLESVAPSDRTFIRPSRRGAERTDVVLPGRKREGWILNVVLDTSGSMTEEIPRALGAIADFCEAVAVDQVRLVQCDTAVTSDQFLQPAEVARYEVTGYGGSDLTPALRHLADDPNVEAVVVLTDGDIEYPREEMPYAVLWVLPAHGSASFQPPYGAVIEMQPSDSNPQFRQ